ncbi:hypothetical protein BDQ12DRAFT_661196 [Crucibulum laeve]|uniref:Tetraspanin family-domain-containing protein n=1 Tax=Crucibulum laeve TaxID=68775 RepID=A0A5C3MKJ8_9AGAR|nr:hypothetical protein BDQ12DRAFT_661196 [Crucibulum laeve]
MAAKFLCCLPLRFGVLLISFLQFLASGATAGLVWWLLWYTNEHSVSEITQSMKISIIITGSVSTLGALIGLFGFLGAILRKSGLVLTFLFVLYLVLGLQIAGTIYFLITFYKTRGQSLEECVNVSISRSGISVCNALEEYKKISQGGMIVSLIVPILVQILFKAPSQTEVYQPVKPTDDSFPALTQPNTKYPYADASNSFGRSSV